MIPLSLVDGTKPAEDCDPPLDLLGGAKTSQNRSVSSEAAETTVAPSGLTAVCKARDVWPSRVLILAIEGYFQRLSSFRANP